MFIVRRLLFRRKQRRKRNLTESSTSDELNLQLLQEEGSSRKFKYISRKMKYFLRIEESIIDILIEASTIFRFIQDRNRSQCKSILKVQ